MTSAAILLRMQARIMLFALLAFAAVAALVFAEGRQAMPLVRGSLASEGSGWDTWSATPTSCSLDPQDARPAAESSTRVSLVWLDPEAGDQTRFERWTTSPDKPLQLDLIARPADSAHPLLAVLETVKHGSPLLLDSAVCSRLELVTRPDARLMPEGRGALAGTLTLECRSAGRHLSGTMQFERCGL